MVTILRALVVVSFGTFAAGAQASELSLVSGIYKSQKDEVNNDGAGGQTSLQIGARYSGELATDKSWLVEGLVSTVKHDAPSGRSDPADDNSFALGGGLRWYFDKMSEKVRPLFQGRFGLKNHSYTETTITATATTPAVDTKRDDTSLFYAADGGFRFEISRDYFYKIELPLFETSLYKIAKATTGEGATKVESESRHVDLYVQTFSPLTSGRFSVGMRF